MSVPKKSYIYHVTFYTGPRPAGPTIGNSVSIPFGAETPLLPRVGEDLIWQDKVNGGGARGTVAEASLVHITRSQGLVTLNVQVDCINSIRRSDLPDSQILAQSGFDATLVGTWNNGGSRPVEITPDAQLFVLDTPAPFVLSNGGNTLTFPNTNPVWEFSRLSGDPAGVVGLWERFESEDGVGTWREEWVFRADGSYTYHWSLDGTFDSEGIGTYEDDGSAITMRERRAQISTGPGAQMTISQYFGPLQTGTYVLDVSGDSWTFTDASGSITYTRVT